MIVCHCGVVSDREIRSAIACGATDECSIASTCGAALGCGGCLPAIRQMLVERGLPVDPALDAAGIRAALVAATAPAVRQVAG